MSSNCARFTRQHCAAKFAFAAIPASILSYDSSISADNPYFPYLIADGSIVQRFKHATAPRGDRLVYVDGGCIPRAEFYERNCPPAQSSRFESLFAQSTLTRTYLLHAHVGKDPVRVTRQYRQTQANDVTDVTFVKTLLREATRAHLHTYVPYKILILCA